MAIATWGGIAIVNGWVLFAPPDHPGNRLGLRRFQTPEIAADVRIGQSFKMNAPDLNAIDVRPAAIGPVSGSVRLELRDIDISDGPVMRAAEVAAADLVREGLYRFQFAPVKESEDRFYQLDISASPDAPSKGVVMRASRGEGFRDGTLLFNDRARWGDLAFQTHTPTVSTFRQLFGASNLPRSSGVIALAGLFISWLALGVVLLEAAKPR